jgi:hypothetical protein
MSNHIPIPDRAFEFAVRITKLCSYLDKQPGTPRLLAAQLFRSGTSIGAHLLAAIIHFLSAMPQQRSL